MADPRITSMGDRRANLSPLMEALNRSDTNGVPNFCPFGCVTEDLDERGHCGHLVGFYNGGSTYEPRCVRKRDGSVFVDGTKRQPMQKDFVLVQITTSARVYSPKLKPELSFKRGTIDRALAEVAARESAILAEAARISSPVLNGKWEGSVYDTESLDKPTDPK